MTYLFKISIFLTLFFSSFYISPCSAGLDSYLEEPEEAEYMPGVTPIALTEAKHCKFAKRVNHPKINLNGLSKDKKLRLVAISDIHIYENAVGYSDDTSIPITTMAKKIPKGDILIIAGDLTASGSLRDVQEFRNFIDAISVIEIFKYIIYIPGNHDRILDEPYYRSGGYLLHNDIKNPEDEIRKAREIMTHDLPQNVFYLLDQPITLEGYRFYGTPWVEGDMRWGFSISEEELAKKWSQIPNNTEILISHMPPHTHGDFENFNVLGRPFTHTGSKSLLERVLTIQPIVHIFGHTHEGYGATLHENAKTLFVNAATCDGDYNPTQKPIIIDLPKK